jgi:hypothetical protein
MEGTKMVTADVVRRANEPGPLALRHGPRWSSLEQLRKVGARQLGAQLGPDQVGWLRVRDREFVIIDAKTWHKVYGCAREVNRLQGTLVLIRQAIQLMFHVKKESGGTDLALQHLSDLVFRVPELSVETPDPGDLTFEDAGDDEDVAVGNLELDPKRVKRPGAVRRRSSR